MPYKVNIGDAIPAFKIKDMDAYELTDEDLIGSPLVLYFYPKDDTPTCTTEACDFRDKMERLDAMDVLVIGISPDTTESHEKFSAKHRLNFTLLGDENKEMCKRFDVLHGAAGNVERTTFVIDSDGIIRWIERPVNVAGHVDRVIHAIQEISEMLRS